MNIRGERSTRTGRVVYNRKPHHFTEKDAARVTRQALNFPKYDPATGLEQYADYTFRPFLTYAFKHNFLPMYRMFYTEFEKDPNADLAEKIGWTVAYYLGIPKYGYDLIVMIKDVIMGSPYSGVIKLKPEFASIITSVAYEVGTIYEEDIYGRTH